MSCKLRIATEVKQEILNCDAATRQQIGDFLLALQENPFPRNKTQMAESAFYVQLPCGFYLSWQVIADEQAMLQLALTGKGDDVLVRVLGLARVRPRK